MQLSTEQVLALVAAERQRQDAKWGMQEHSPAMWLTILAEEVGELAHACLEAQATGSPLPAQIAEAVQVAAVAVAMIEDMARWWSGESEEIEAAVAKARGEACVEQESAGLT